MLFWVCFQCILQYKKKKKKKINITLYGEIFFTYYDKI